MSNLNVDTKTKKKEKDLQEFKSMYEDSPVKFGIESPLPTFEYEIYN